LFKQAQIDKITEYEKQRKTIWTCNTKAR
jgi:hypothetical protein